ncbi:cytochrome c biogenesis protein CcsA [Verrucomicrobiaceae bacterium N1E253]|uniref:Cytochrome c biogenesis protein CcsA n=1 Tax=Oceaniferula marina TaxID=2748318 RepID=A0A851GGE0_9BACT|nr:cytochrome c biogenesis protein CcsA [Oceaniferula marina]NWK54891.1 cytochrome c biogenesis protein CcsA [Oceaniferula marina]
MTSMFRLSILISLFLSGVLLGQEKPTPRSLSPDAGKTLSSIPVQNAGRPKPLDSFARFTLLACYHKSKMEDMSAANWMAQLLLDPDTAYDVKCFRLKNEDLIEDLGLTPSPDHKHVYSFNDLRTIIDSQRERIMDISARPKESRSLIESQLLKLNEAVRHYFSVSRSFTCLTPELTIHNEQLAKELNLPKDKQFSFFELYQRWDQLREIVNKINKDFDRSDVYHNAVFSLAASLRDMQQHEGTLASLSIVPPKDDQIHDEWKTPWQVLATDSQAKDHEIAYLKDLQETVNSLISGKDQDNKALAEKIRSYSSDKIQSLTKAELVYNRMDAFTRSLAFYLLGFLFLCASWMFAGKPLRWTSWGLVLLGLLIHTAGILLRMYIRGRPAPVTNIYESVIFVGFTCVLIGLILEWIRRDGLGLIIAIFPGAILHFVGFRYASDGDTMGRLVAVLDSNFWLSTHVVTITLGYGFAAAAGLLANIYLYIRLIKPDDKKFYQGISKAFIGITLFALLLCIVGTILGGIWGDQSWGRFWGWDPKENGALLICLWLLIILHGKWGKQLKELGIATMLSLTNITVLLAWFGVNLLSVGLHNYGFTEGAARNLTIACGAIVVLTFIPSAAIFIRDQSRAPKQVPPTPQP